MHQNLFQRREVAELMIATIFRYLGSGEFQVHEYVIMPDHIHLLLSLDDESPLSRAMQLIKGGFSHGLRENGISLRTVWQQGYYDRRVRDVNEFAEFANYVRENPVRRGLVDEAAKYPYSSATRRERLDEFSGAKAPCFSKGIAIDAGLKARTTRPVRDKDAGLKARSTELNHVLS